MGYRAEWLSHTGRASRHRETVLFAFDREVNPKGPVRLLDIGVENGGSAEVWRRVLPEGSVVVTLDDDPATGPDLLVDVTDRAATKAALRGEWFDYIVDDSRTGRNWHLWPFLRPGGLLMVEDEIADHYAADLSECLLDGDTGWLPGEELLRVCCYPGLLVVEKRHPRATPYLDIVQGEEYPVVALDDLIAAGAKRVVT
jgi:hypothetical protein